MVGRHLSSELCSCPLFKDIQVWWYMCVMPVLRATAGDPEFEASLGYSKTLSPKTEVRYKHPKLALFTFLRKEGNHAQLCHLRLGFVQSGLGGQWCVFPFAENKVLGQAIRHTPCGCSDLS